MSRYWREAKLSARCPRSSPSLHKSLFCSRHPKTTQRSYLYFSFSLILLLVLNRDIGCCQPAAPPTSWPLCFRRWRRGLGWRRMSSPWPPGRLFLSQSEHNEHQSHQTMKNARSFVLRPFSQVWKFTSRSRCVLLPECICFKNKISPEQRCSSVLFEELQRRLMQ